MFSKHIVYEQSGLPFATLDIAKYDLFIHPNNNNKVRHDDKLQKNDKIQTFLPQNSVTKLMTVLARPKQVK